MKTEKNIERGMELMRLGRLMRPMRLLGLMGLGLVALSFGLVGCSDDVETGMQYMTLEAQPYSTPFVEQGEGSQSRSLGTRSDWEPPTGYKLYYEITGLFANQKDLTNKSIDVFFTRDSKDPLHGAFSYKKPYGSNPGTWRLNMDIEETGDYYVYGYIPKEAADNATIAGNGTFSDGVVLTINGISTVTTCDACVVVGANNGTDENHDGGLTTGDFKVNAKRVQIGDNNPNPEHNYIYLLFDHIYSSLRFSFTVNSYYNELRTIRLTKLELIGYADANEENKIKARYNVTVQLKGNTTGTSPIEEVTFTPDETSADVAYTPLYEWDGTENTDEDSDNEIILKSGSYTNFLGCIVPGQNTYFKLRSTYDVFDKKGNLIRPGCQAENTIDLYKIFGVSTTTRGHSYTLNITVQPTFLYVLSDEDLDNPTMKIEN